jgi:hypothetical protein
MLPAKSKFAFALTDPQLVAAEAPAENMFLLKSRPGMSGIPHLTGSVV